MTTELFVGLMSGTSVDSIDACLIACTQAAPDAPTSIRLLCTHAETIDKDTRGRILQLCQPGSTTNGAGTDAIERAGLLDRELGGLFASAVKRLLQTAAIGREQVTAIGSHGQTIRHRPPSQERPAAEAFTSQIGDPNTIAELTGITTVADFRRRDVAAGGQGAPLVPRFHQAAFANAACNRAIVNIGGMANVTQLHGQDLIAGFDTGPGNVLLDEWVNHQLGKPYDRDGGWAASGRVIPSLLAACSAHPFFQLQPPKSTGREQFNLHWLQQQMTRTAPEHSPEDVQATVLELSAQTISASLLNAESAPDEVFVCGGGAYNVQLMRCLSEKLAPIPVCDTAELGIAPEWVEASAFAWLARQTLRGLSGNFPAVTGARGPRILGSIHPA